MSVQGMGRGRKDCKGLASKEGDLLEWIKEKGGDWKLSHSRFKRTPLATPAALQTPRSCQQRTPEHQKFGMCQGQDKATGSLARAEQGPPRDTAVGRGSVLCVAVSCSWQPFSWPVGHPQTCTTFRLLEDGLRSTAGLDRVSAEASHLLLGRSLTKVRTSTLSQAFLQSTETLNS